MWIRDLWRLERERTDACLPQQQIDEHEEGFSQPRDIHYERRKEVSQYEATSQQEEAMSTRHSTHLQFAWGLYPDGTHFDYANVRKHSTSEHCDAIRCSHSCKCIARKTLYASNLPLRELDVLLEHFWRVQVCAL